MRALIAAREPLYREVADFVADADRPSPEAVADAILTAWHGVPYIPIVIWCVCGLRPRASMVGSFLNVLIARLPYEKSIIWPSSRCFACFRPIRPLDNIPILGYLRLRGRCRHCGAQFSSRYLWVELGTGLAFLGAVRGWRCC